MHYKLYYIKTMDDFKISVIENQTLVADSRDIAQELGIEHESFMKTINTRQASIEKYFGSIRFEIGTTQGKVHNPKPLKFALLTEDQYIAVATLSRNTAKVIEVKMKLVKAFSLAKQALKELSTNDSKGFEKIAFKTEASQDPAVSQIRNYALESASKIQAIGDIAELSRTLAAYHREYGEIKLLERNLTQAKAKLQSRFTTLRESIKPDLITTIRKIVYEFTCEGNGTSIPCKQFSDRCSDYGINGESFCEIYRTMDSLGYTRKETPKGIHWVLM